MVSDNHDPTDRHELTAWEPVMQKSKWVYQDGELVLLFSKDKDNPDLSEELFRYECSCGHSFDDWESASDHLMGEDE